MHIATSGAFRQPTPRVGWAIGAIAIGAMCVLGYLGWRHWIRVPSPAAVCERVEQWSDPVSFERSAFSTLDVGDTKPRGDTFHDRCMWFFESMRDVDNAFYSDVARCVDHADDLDAALTCTHSP
jgi:hypothetical protein